MDKSALVSTLGGLLAGDLIGSAYEGLPGNIGRRWLTSDSCLTDDSLMAITTARTFRACGEEQPTREAFETAYCSCIGSAPSMHCYFSPDMLLWADNAIKGGFMEGNGAGIRAAAIALTAVPQADIADVITASVNITHSSEATALASALADAISMLRSGVSPSNVMQQMEVLVPMMCVYSAEAYRSTPMDTTLWWTLPAALHIGLTSDSYSALFDEVLFIGGDTDSIGAMAGAIGHARWGLKGLSNEIVLCVKEELKHAAFACC